MDVMAKVVRIMWVPVLVFALYTLSVFWRRDPMWPFGRRPYIERDPMAAYGKSVKILQFYGPREIAAGGKALVCYSVVNATAVRLDPPVERVWPALSRCFNVTPTTSTRYTLTAEGAKHTTVSKSLEVAVKP